MTNPFLHSESYITQLKHIETQISQNLLHVAAQELNQLVAQEPQDPRLYLLGSLLAEAAGNRHGVLQAAEKAHQLAPQWATATIYLAGVLANASQLSNAVAMAELAVEQASTQDTPTVFYTELLSKASAIVLRLGFPALSVRWLREANRMKPNDLALLHQLGLAMVESGNAMAAVDVYDDLLHQVPDNTTLRVSRLKALLAAGQLAPALVDVDNLLAVEPNSQEYLFFREIALGRIPNALPDQVVRAIFDSCAVRYDHDPSLRPAFDLMSDVLETINHWYLSRTIDVLDLGCGTGQLGVRLGAKAGTLVGVDISPEMVRIASSLGVYDRIHVVNLTDAVKATPGGLYDVITALDVLAYVGDLGAVITNAYRILVPGGHFVFSCEEVLESNTDYILQRCQRYAYTRGYVQRLLDLAGFVEITLTSHVARRVSGNTISGFLIAAKKNSMPMPGKTVRRPPKNAKLAHPAQ